MNIEKDSELELEAIRLLDGYLIGIEPSMTEAQSNIDKDLLLKMYEESKSIVQQNVEDYMLSQVADSVWGTCVRFVRSAYLKNNETIINGDLHYLDSGSLFNCAQKEYAHMLKLAEKC